MANFNLKDSTGQFWGFSVDASGNIQSATVPVGPLSVIVLQGPSDQAFQLVTSTGGVLSGSGLSDPKIVGATHVLMVDPTGAFQYQLTVDSHGQPHTALDQSWQPGTPVGELYPTQYYPTFSQPGGPGTPTFPQQDIGEKLGTFTAGCGHWFNNWWVPNSAFLGVPSAYIACPLCGYVQQIVTPQSLIYTDPFYIIVG